jgi:hypothetical protein
MQKPPNNFGRREEEEGYARDQLCPDRGVSVISKLWLICFLANAGWPAGAGLVSGSLCFDTSQFP